MPLALGDLTRACRGEQGVRQREEPEGVFMGSSPVRSIANGCVDELHFMIGAGVVGEGVRAFETRPPGSLRLLDTRTFDGSSLLLARYAVER